jgi:hypothetical protein
MWDLLNPNVHLETDVSRPVQLIAKITPYYPMQHGHRISGNADHILPIESKLTSLKSLENLFDRR